MPPRRQTSQKQSIAWHFKMPGTGARHASMICYHARMVLRTFLGAGVLALSVGMGIVGCDLAPPDVFDPQLLQQDERTHAPEVKPAALRPLPTTREGAFADIGPQGQTEINGRPVRPSTGPDLDSDPIIRMSLHEIIHRAMANNHDVKVAAYQPAIEGARVIEASANFDPAFFANIQYQNKNDATGGSIFNSFNGGIPFVSLATQTEQNTFQTGLQQNLGSGGQVQLQYQNTYNWFSPQQTLYNPFYQSNLSLSLNQPLLKNFGYDVNHAQITINRLNQKVDLLEFRKAVEQNASDIEKAYWQLVQTERDIRIQQQLVAQTESTYNILYKRLQQRIDVSPLQVAQAQTQLELRRSQLISFKSQARDLSDQLKALMSDPEFPVTSNIVILPADPPLEDRVEFDLQDEIDTAMENRLELGEQQLKVDAATVTVGVAKNNLLPELDFIGSLGPEGAGGDLGSSITSNSEMNHWEFAAGFKLQVPLGNRAARAIWKRALLQRMQAIEQYRSYVEQIAVDVKTSARAVYTTWEIIRSSRRSRFAAEDALTRINTRERSGEPLTPEFVQTKLQLQDALAESLENEAEAIANYNIALADLEKAKGTLLRYNNVVLQEEPIKMESNGLMR
ncbi:MAG TPA: TolC family protein [Tepidisphaeraceae bacterium]|jgi:outer membrane protein TolC|nr:TolC family protein [Tepidisphaeraceae bacterium]